MNPLPLTLWAVGGAIVGAGMTTYATAGSPRGLRRSAIPTAAGAAGLLFAITAVRFGDNLLVLPFTYLAAIGVVAAIVDVLDHRLPSDIALSGFLVVGTFLVLEAIAEKDPADLVRAGAAGTVTVAFHLILALASRGGLGAGDVKLAGVLGLALGRLGWPALLTGFVLAWICAALAVALLPREAPGPKVVPMGPFLLIGFAAAVALHR